MNDEVKVKPELAKVVPIGSKPESAAGTADKFASDDNAVLFLKSQAALIEVIQGLSNTCKMMADRLVTVEKKLDSLFVMYLRMSRKETDGGK